MKMPPKKAKLSDRQIADMEQWIKDGCADPRNGELPELEKEIIDISVEN